MKNILISSSVIAVIASSPAFAGAQTDIEQLMSSVQDALNELSITHNGNNIDQNALNAANLINREGEDFDDILQESDQSAQDAMNKISTVFGHFGNVDQSATNVTNSLGFGDISTGSGFPDVNTVEQNSLGLMQSAANRIEFNQALGFIGPVTQGATNAANLVSSGTAADEATGTAQNIGLGVDVEESISQEINSTSSQSAVNAAVTGNVNTAVKDVAQSATNVGNSITVDDLVGTSDQAMRAGQTASNRIESGNGPSTNFFGTADNALGIEDSTQAATNAANLVTAQESQSNVTQTVSLSANQAAKNVAVGLNGDGGVSALAQAATNVMNSMTIDASAGVDTVALSQVVQGGGGGSLGSPDYTQLANNRVEFADGDLIGESSQAATNAANLATIGSLNTGISQNYSYNGSFWDNGQDIKNVAAYTGAGGGHLNGMVKDFDQSGTNVANVLTTGSLPSFVGTVEVTQAFEGVQTGLNRINGHGGMNTVSQTMTNVANSIGMATN